LERSHEKVIGVFVMVMCISTFPTWRERSGIVISEETNEIAMRFYV